MTLYRDRYRVESPRMSMHGYGPGLYFITVCTAGRQPWLGAVRDEEVVLSEIGMQVEALWRAVPAHYPDVRLDAFVIMPDHFHAIVGIEADPNRRTPAQRSCRDVACNVSTVDIQMSAISPRRGTLPVVIRSFKSAVTRWCGRNGHAEFAWQSRYYEHLVRNERERDLVRDYLAANPFRWAWKGDAREHQWLRSILRLDLPLVETGHAPSPFEPHAETGHAPSLRREEKVTA